MARVLLKVKTGRPGPGLSLGPASKILAFAGPLRTLGVAAEFFMGIRTSFTLTTSLRTPILSINCTELSKKTLTRNVLQFAFAFYHAVLFPQ